MVSMSGSPAASRMAKATARMATVTGQDNRPSWPISCTIVSVSHRTPGPGGVAARLVPQTSPARTMHDASIRAP
jgi:hypothetical protein